MVDILKLLSRWIGVDRIRVSNQTGRLGRLRIGDQFLWEDSILEVVDRRVLTISESESRVSLLLVDRLNEVPDRHELQICARTHPRLELTGKLRFCKADGFKEIDIDDHDIMPIQSRNVMHD